MHPIDAVGTNAKMPQGYQAQQGELPDLQHIQPSAAPRPLRVLFVMPMWTTEHRGAVRMTPSALLMGCGRGLRQEQKRHLCDHVKQCPYRPTSNPAQEYLDQCCVQCVRVAARKRERYPSVCR